VCWEKVHGCSGIKYYSCLSSHMGLLLAARETSFVGCHRVEEESTRLFL